MEIIIVYMSHGITGYEYLWHQKPTYFENIQTRLGRPAACRDDGSIRSRKKEAAKDGRV